MNRTLRHWLPWIAGGLATAWALSMLWWLLLEPAQARSDATQLIIPEGTAAAIARGEPAPFIPNSLELGRNGELLVINRDSADHEVGAWTIPAGGRATIASTGEDGEFTCTVHPAGVLGYTIDERPPFVTTVYSALLLGLPVGVVFGFASFVGRRLKPGDPEAVS